MKNIESIARWAAILGVAIALAIAIMAVVSILGRAAFKTPIQGDIEITQIGIALAISLMLPWCQWQKSNIIVDFFTQKSAPKVQMSLDAMGALLLAALYALLAWRTTVGAMSVHAAQETTMILGMPMVWAYVSLAPGLALAAVIAFVQAVRLATKGNAA